MDQPPRTRLSCLTVAAGILVLDVLAWVAAAVLGARVFGWWGE